MPHVLVRSIVRPDKADAVMATLLDAGYPAVTKVAVFGRGKQRGLKVGDIHYDELPKELLMTVIPVADWGKGNVDFRVLSGAQEGRERVLAAIHSLYRGRTAGPGCGSDNDINGRVF